MRQGIKAHIFNGSAKGNRYSREDEGDVQAWTLVKKRIFSDISWRISVEGSQQEETETGLTL